MARNQEKANSMLNKWLASKSDDVGPGLKRRKRPYMASECKNLNECDRWRSQVLKEIGQKVMEIQNAGLPEERVRDLNDEINKLIRVKYAWEKQIASLGGPNYSKSAPKVYDNKGNEVKGMSGPGYKYFGVAKNLPGVKELFQKPVQKKARRTRKEMFSSINADYFGYRDEDDGVLLEVERESEVAVREEAIREWESGQSELASTQAKGDDAQDPGYVAFVPLPDEKEIEKQIIDKKKADLLAKYATPALQSEQAEAEALLGKGKS